jgi:hypothetical protein
LLTLNLLGANKFDALSKFFVSVLDGTADLKVVKPQPEEVIIAEEKPIPIPVAVEPDQIVLEAVPETETEEVTATTTTSVSSEETTSVVHEVVTEVPEPPEPTPSITEKKWLGDEL